MNSQMLNLLLIEDSTNDARQICLMLGHAKKIKFNVVRAANIAEALEELPSQPFDVILMDLALPDTQGLSGFLAMHRVAEKLPILIVCGLQNEELALKAVQHGA